MTRAEAALLYASWGWHVLPVLPGGKAPACAHGVHDATIDPVQIAKWWAQSDYNIGVAAGSKSGVAVIDVDPRNGGEASWQEWIDKYGMLDGGICALTAGGGYHYLVVHHPEVRSRKLADGLDLLADGRYFVVYPSTINERSYQWEASSDPFEGVAPTVLPQRWLEAVRKPQDRSNVPAGGLIVGSRNSGLTALGGAMRRYGMGEAEIMAALMITNETRCEIPLPASELSQIVRSVCRYEPETDVAAAASLGHDAAEAILEASRAETQEYYFVRATAFLSQPAPIQWVIKGWIPDGGVSMVYGESGSGKTFITLDMACHMAAGLSWNNVKTRPGLVVFMAGEGNYGLRQRIAAWCKAHGVQNLDNLLVSNKAIDIDSPAAAAQIINAVREVTREYAVGIFIDTVNNHMAGDENSARDTRAMFNSCNIVARALQSSVIFNHHTGHAAESKHRARGSSAWKASLDVSILISKNDDVIEITCTKMKDAELPQPILGRLERIPLGWIDEDGEEISGAVFRIDKDQPEKAERKDQGAQKDIRKFTDAWFHSGAEDRNGMPYLSRNALIDYFVTNQGKTTSTAKTYAQESKKGRLIYNLLEANIIRAHEEGWVVFENETASTLMVLRGKR